MMEQGSALRGIQGSAEHSFSVLKFFSFVQTRYVLILFCPVKRKCRMLIYPARKRMHAIIPYGLEFGSLLTSKTS